MGKKTTKKTGKTPIEDDEEINASIKMILDEFVTSHDESIQFDDEAVDALGEAMSDYIKNLFKGALEIASKSKRKSVKPEDIREMAAELDVRISPEDIPDEEEEGPKKKKAKTVKKPKTEKKKETKRKTKK